MREVKYSATKLAIGLVAGVALTFFAYKVLPVAAGMLYFGCLAFAVLGPALIVGSARKLLGNRDALRWDDRGLEVTGMWRRTTLDWRAIRQIGVTVMTSRAAGVIKTGEYRSLTIVPDSGRMGSHPRHVSRAFLELDAAQFGAVVRELQQCLERARQGQPAVSAGVVPAHRHSDPA